MNATGDSHNNKQTRDLRDSFAAAWSGLARTIRTQRNMRVHLIVAATVTGIGGMLQISAGEWCALVLTITGVMCLELMNTALEATVDLVTSETHPLARIAKDAAAAAVLLMSAGSVMIGLLIFVPRLLAILQQSHFF